MYDYQAAAVKQGKSFESVRCAMLKACDACADMGQLERTAPIRKTFLEAVLYTSTEVTDSDVPSTSASTCRSTEFLESADY